MPRHVNQTTNKNVSVSSQLQVKTYKILLAEREVSAMHLSLLLQSHKPFWLLDFKLLTERKHFLRITRVCWFGRTSMPRRLPSKASHPLSVLLIPPYKYHLIARLLAFTATVSMKIFSFKLIGDQNIKTHKFSI